MSIISNEEIAGFWRALSEYVNEWRIRFAAVGDWAALSCLQDIAVRIGDASACDISTISIAAGLDLHLKRMNSCGAECDKLLAFVQSCSQLLQNHEERENASQQALARQLLSMHRFLDGVSGAEQFGALHTVQNDIHYGLGIGLKDGSMLRFLSSLVENEKRGEDSIVSRCFDDDADGLVDAVQGGQASLEQYFQSQMILRYDPVMSRKQFELSDGLRTRFDRLAAEPEVRRSQLNMLAGKRFSSAKTQASRTGIRSLRGFAMLFDLESLTPSDGLQSVHSAQNENQKCLSLADAVLSRMHGHMAAHWQNRLESVFHGSGCVEGRFYDERRFFGENAGEKSWQQADILLDDEQITAEPTVGHIYIVSPGDRLKSLTDRAYNGEGDYRDVLKQNPHIIHPEKLEPGTRLYFPELHKKESPETLEISELQWDRDNHVIAYGGRLISAITPMSDEQIEVFCNRLQKIPVHQMYRCEAVELSDGAAVSCQRETLFISEKENEISVLKAGFDSVFAWAVCLAAQVRGDVIYRNDCFLPLASISSQPHRQAWFVTSLKRLVQDEQALPPKLIIHARNRFVDIESARDAHIVRLENDDFLAIRNQPHRRLADYIAPPVVQMNVLSQLWLSSVFSIPFEIAVPPVSHANQYASVQPDGETQFLVPMGTPVYPIMAGVVVDCGRFPGMEYGILIRHHNGLYSRYSCLATLCVENGQIVTASVMIARSGGSEFDGQPKLRLELKHSENDIVDWQAFGGENIGYFDVICHHWPIKPIFESFMVE